MATLYITMSMKCVNPFTHVCVCVECAYRYEFIYYHIFGHPDFIYKGTTL